jgi:hypothetical protein
LRLKARKEKGQQSNEIVESIEKVMGIDDERMRRYNLQIFKSLNWLITTLLDVNHREGTSRSQKR